MHIKEGDKVFVTQGPLHGARGTVVDIMDDDINNDTVAVIVMAENWGAYMAGDQVDFHPYELRSIPN